MSGPALLDEAGISRARDTIGRLNAALGGAIVGQETVIADLVHAIVAGGHVLLEGMPGLGKTTLVKALAKCLGKDLARIQCTPDLMPADITGSDFLTPADGAGGERLTFHPGPIFSQMVMVDEINRAPPKTQSALLEAMQEGQVTYSGRNYPLPRPFWVIATQNPIEVEGTYPLPEAQLDRFMAKLDVPYPDADALAAVPLDGEPTDLLEAVVVAGELDGTMAAARQIVIAPDVRRAAVSLIMATHPDRAEAAAAARAHFRYGASPRALQSLLRMARARALGDGRAHVAVDDVIAGAIPALRHRILLSIESGLDGVGVDDALRQVIAECFGRG